MWADFIKLEEFDALPYKAEHQKSILKSGCSTEARNQRSRVRPLTCVFTAMHLQMGQLKVPLAAARMSTNERTLLAGL